MLVSPFISFWIGEEYILNHTTLLLITAILFVDLVRNIIDSFNNAYGLFQDVWATMVEACINIGCSIWFGYLWGLPGILVGVLLSLLLIIFCGNHTFYLAGDLKFRFFITGSFILNVLFLEW